MQPRATAVALSGADQAVVPGPAVYRGITLRETGGSATATCVVYDNASAASGTILDAYTVAANGTASVIHDGIRAVNGIYVDVGGSGVLAGSVRIG